MFAQRLKELRKASGMNQQELGEKIGVAKSTIAGYEKGFRKPKIKVINELAEIFHTSADYLLGISNDKTPKEPSKDIEKILKEPDYHYKGRKLTNDDLELLLKYLDTIYKMDPNKDLEISNLEQEPEPKPNHI
ncbi:helix-turn-helix domain-containing protein [Neobacillus sp. C211]|uniref:helix-turn-helix domain-containing protein n=1 Tax=unclassified Neobacillus TaxID=2675272 RepID=UPI00397AFD8C